MDKQIEEMAKVIEEAMSKARRTLGGHNNISKFYAKMLVNAGYRKIPENAVVNMLNDEMEMLILSLGFRKKSDTANEILQELLKEENLETVYFTDENGNIRDRQLIRIEKVKDILEGNV